MKKQSVLIIDDEESIRISLERMLKKENYRTETAENGSIALEKLENNYYDLVLTDIMMDEISGIQLLRIIKEKYSTVVVLLMTGYASINSAIEALRLGASDYIIKPCSKEQILSGINNAIKNNNVYRNKYVSQNGNKNLKVLNGKKPLTKKELMVFEYLIHGMTSQHMATQLNITIPTIKFHLKNIYTKLGIKGRREIYKALNNN